MNDVSPALHHLRFPGEGAEYRAARNALLVEEMELRRQTERVAAQRRTLPAGAALPPNCQNWLIAIRPLPPPTLRLPRGRCHP